MLLLEDGRTGLHRTQLLEDDNGRTVDDPIGRAKRTADGGRGLIGHNSWRMTMGGRWTTRSDMPSGRRMADGPIGRAKRTAKGVKFLELED